MWCLGITVAFWRAARTHGPILLPVIVVGFIVVFPRLWALVVGAFVLAGFAFVGGFSVGVFYLPPALALFSLWVSELSRRNRQSSS
jgi:hypothetical protein